MRRNSAFTIALLLLASIAWADAPVIQGVLNAVSNDSTFSPGDLVSVFGKGLGPTPSVEASGSQMPTVLGGVRVLVNGTAAPLLFASASQVIAQLPSDTKIGTAAIAVEYQGVKSTDFALSVSAVVPKFATDAASGLPVVMHSDLSQVSRSSPAAPGENITAFASGLGSATAAAITVTVGGKAANVLATAPVSGNSTPLAQVSFKLANDTPFGEEQPMVMIVGGASSKSVPLPVLAADYPKIASVVNGATFSLEAVAVAGSFMTVFGKNFGSKTDLNAFPSLVSGGVSVTFDDVPAPLFHLIPNVPQINLLAPSELPDSGTVKVRVLNASGSSFAFPVTMAEAAPGVFRIADPSNSRRRNGLITINNTRWRVMPDSMAQAIGFTSCTGLLAAADCGQPAKVGDDIQLWTTGLGKATSTGTASGTSLKTGAVAPVDGSTVYRTVVTPSVTIGGIPVAIQFSGITPGFAGLYQVNVRIPPGVPTADDVPVQLTTPNGRGDMVTIAIR